jgi:hypothetical protein
MLARNEPRLLRVYIPGSVPRPILPLLSRHVNYGTAIALRMNLEHFGLEFEET